MLQRIHVRALVFVTALVWAVLLIVNGVAVSFEYMAPYSVVTTVVLLTIEVFDRWVWRWRLLHPWFVKRPVLHGTWRARFVSNWTDPATGAPYVGRGYMVIRQTYSRLSMRLVTPESSSELLVHEIVRAHDGTYSVLAVYRNDPNAAVRARSQIHYGAFRLTVSDSPLETIRGVYWTDRLTCGDLELTDRRSEVCDSLDAARLLFGDP